MSERASELLRGLEREVSLWAVESKTPLEHALPEIIAVVVAAEEQLITPPEVWAALDALVSKLSGETAVKTCG